MKRVPIRSNADILEELRAKITARWQDAVSSIVAVGHMLIEARPLVGYGEWGAYCARLPFNASTATKLMAIAEHPVLSNPAHVNDLPASWGTLYELSHVPEHELTQWIESGAVSANLERKDAIELKKTKDPFKLRDLHKAFSVFAYFMSKYPEPQKLLEVASEGDDDYDEWELCFADVETLVELQPWLGELHAAHLRMKEAAARDWEREREEIAAEIAEIEGKDNKPKPRRKRLPELFEKDVRQELQRRRGDGNVIVVTNPDKDY